MIALVKLIDEHGGALNYDLMTRMGASIDDVPTLVGWRDLNDFISYLPSDSALFNEMHPNLGGWGTPLQTNSLLADIYDAINAFAYMYAKSHTKRTIPKPKPYPRPFVTQDNDEQKLGSEPIPVSEFEDWWNSFD